MGQRTKLITEIFGFQGWKVKEAFFEGPDGRRYESAVGLEFMRDVRLVLRVERQWMQRCSRCGAACRVVHERLQARRWKDLPWAGRPVEVEAALVRVKCRRCGTHAVELVPWADPYQRESKRFGQHLALQASSMPVMHVATQHGVSWSTVHRAEMAALRRWEATRSTPPLRQVGIDEKWLGRRHRLEHHFVTIISNLETGEPVWIGPGRGQKTVQRWLATLSAEQKAVIELFALDMHGPFLAAIRADPVLGERPVVHDPFHVMKRVNQAVDETRRDIFFRAGDFARAMGRGARWIVLRAWENNSVEDQKRLVELLAFNRLLARTYIIKETMRQVLRAPGRASMTAGLRHVLRRTQARRHEHLRSLHDSLVAHREEILALGEHRPATGRIEALNNKWETLVRRGRGYRNYQHFLLKLRFMTANPIRSADGTRRFIALGLQPPIPKAA